MREIIQLLDQKHILLQFNDPEMTSLLAKLGWDGSVRPMPNSDFLMVVDSNVGFNKTNALMQTTLEYSINLSTLTQPSANLTLSLTNHSPSNSEIKPECIQAGGQINELPLELRDYIMEDCYWTYLRVYTPAGSQLLASTPHEIPPKWLLREQMIPARTDVLDENINGTQAFGSLMVVPKGKSLQTSFTYQLPAMVVSNETDGKTYQYGLKIQKQPGTQNIALSLRIILPPEAAITKMPPGLTQNPQNESEWVLNTNLEVDLNLEIQFQKAG
jgi:hypothetical protein